MVRPCVQLRLACLSHDHQIAAAGFTRSVPSSCLCRCLLPCGPPLPRRLLRPPPAPSQPPRQLLPLAPAPRSTGLPPRWLSLIRCLPSAWATWGSHQTSLLGWRALLCQPPALLPHPQHTWSAARRHPPAWAALAWAPASLPSSPALCAAPGPGLLRPPAAAPRALMGWAPTAPARAWVLPWMRQTPAAQVGWWGGGWLLQQPSVGASNPGTLV